MAGSNPAVSRRHRRTCLMPDTPTFGRYAEIPYDQMTPEQQEGYRSLIETRGRLPGPTKIWVHNPKLAKAAGPLGAHFRTGYSLSEREREIAVVIIDVICLMGYYTMVSMTLAFYDVPANAEGMQR